MPNPVTLNDAVIAAVDYRLNNVHTAMPASIVSYEFQTQKASVQPLLNKVWTDGTTTPFPVLENVPVIFPRSGGAGLTFPVNSGDTCLLLFIERSTDLWLTQGGQVNPDDPRKFDLSDAVAIMGLFPFTVNSTADNNTDLILTYAGSTVRIKQGGAIVIESAATVALGTTTTEVLNVISQLMGFLTGATVMGSAFNGPLNAAFVAQVTALKSQLDAITGTIP
jgi:hypothetical protein